MYIWNTLIIYITKIHTTPMHPRFQGYYKKEAVQVDITYGYV